MLSDRHVRNRRGVASRLLRQTRHPYRGSHTIIDTNLEPRDAELFHPLVWVVPSKPMEHRLLRPRFSWTRIKGESDVQGGSGNGSVEEGEGSWVGATGVAAFVERYNQCWRLEKLAYRTPLEAREQYELRHAA